MKYHRQLMQVGCVFLFLFFSSCYIFVCAGYLVIFLFVQAILWDKVKIANAVNVQVGVFIIGICGLFFIKLFVKLMYFFLFNLYTFISICGLSFLFYYLFLEYNICRLYLWMMPRSLTR